MSDRFARFPDASKMFANSLSVAPMKKPKY